MVYQATKWDVEGIKGGYQQQQQPELQQTTLHANPPSDRPTLIRPDYATRSDFKSYSLVQGTDEYTQFVKDENKYFKSEYHSKRRSSHRVFDDVRLAIKMSGGSKVLYKVIEKDDVESYTRESSPPSECHSTEISTLDGKHAGAGCMSPRPQGLLLPFEIEAQNYVSKSDYGSSFVLGVIDYIITKETYILVIEYPGENWMALDKYMKEHDKFSVSEARSIIKEVIQALLSFKKLGISHGNVLAQNILYHKETGSVKFINFDLSEPREGWSQDNSVQAESSDSASESSEDKPDPGPAETKDLESINYLLYCLLTLKRPFKKTQDVEGGFVEGFRYRLDDPESQLTIDAAKLVSMLFGYDSSSITSIENLLEQPFFTSQ
ncbi:hypothetical protein BASA83_008421 [Batrachochytrium salamandrivorans]|nr:hypothetical protein BASA83_008421 [Batrachochytrium salamandrivorans]